MVICRAVVLMVGLSIVLANTSIEQYEYDLLGRTTKQSVFDGTTEIESTKTDYFITAANAITTILPGGGEVTRTIDALGRTTGTRTNPKHPNATDIVSNVAYDREDNVVFATVPSAATAARRVPAETVFAVERFGDVHRHGDLGDVAGGVFLRIELHPIHRRRGDGDLLLGIRIGHQAARQELPVLVETSIPAVAIRRVIFPHR